ncbi:GNAT family N-acetyltransferase [Thiothrix nivea]|uniref:GCN5-related N-acetyltransferase n=1 Tax=Thiothrix nivea (strain ATCC 35100 / DSM 5205 / JP2) TaxID=870187 RepID=A0A656HIV8_THINJ|nr:GNAT family N-acetyltransferase [Thiothrix nivea]EIJ36313.1 GCN5-related N-acetyltransferase [Thiothrix nivea DSM 5205]
MPANCGNDLTPSLPAEFGEAWRIYEDSFPSAERRSLSQQLNILPNPRYRFRAITSAGKVIGITATWHFDGLLFLEHIAIARDARKSGLGTRIIRELCELNAGLLVLEVELPESGMAEQRRVDWYIRLGFVLNHFPYIQPAFSPDKPPVPLRIMSYPRELSAEEFYRIRDILYREVYGHKPPQ